LLGSLAKSLAGIYANTDTQCLDVTPPHFQATKGVLFGSSAKVKEGEASAQTSKGALEKRSRDMTISAAKKVIPYSPESPSEQKKHKK
jgi:hypothetical protein